MSIFRSFVVARPRVFDLDIQHNEGVPEVKRLHSGE